MYVKLCVYIFTPTGLVKKIGLGICGITHLFVEPATEIPRFETSFKGAQEYAVKNPINCSGYTILLHSLGSFYNWFTNVASYI